MSRWIQRLEAWSPARVLSAAILLVMVLGVLDRLAIPRMSFTLFHALIVAAAGWLTGLRGGLLIALLSTLALSFDEWKANPNPRYVWVIYWNLGLRLGIFALAAYLTATVRRLSRRLEHRVEERTAELARANAELRQAQAALKESEQLYRELIVNQGEGLAIVDAAERFTFVNPAGEAIFGVKPGGLVGRSLQDFTTPQEFARVQAQTQKRRTGEKSRYELQIVRPDGAVRWVQITAVPHPSPTGEFREAFGLFQDITERKEAEAARKASEEKFSHAFRNAPMMMGISAVADGRFLEVNDAFVRISGFSRAEALGKTSVELGWIEPELRRQHLAGLRSGERIHELEMKCRCKNGREIICLCSSEAVVINDQPCLVTLALDITERKQAEAKIQELNETLDQRVRDRTAELESTLRDLREKDAHLNLSLAASSAGTWSWRVASNEAWWDDRYHALYGFAPEEPISTAAWLERVVPEDRERLERRINELLSPDAGDAWEETFRARHPTQGVRWMQGIGRVERDETGRAVRFSGINLDITERRRTTEALHQSELRYQQLYEGMTDAFARVDMTGRFVQCNQAFQQMLGYSEDELRGLTCPGVTPEKWHRMEEQILVKEVLARGYSRIYEKEYRRKNGTIFPTELRTFRIVGHDGRPEGMWAIIRDITERKQLEQALRESEKRFRAIFEQAGVGVAVIETATGRFRQVNQCYCEMIGRTEEEMCATDFMAITHSEDLKADLEQMEALKQGLVPSFAMDKRLLRPDGSLVWVHLTVSPLWGPGEPPDFHIAVVEDISGRVTAEAALRQINLELEARVRERTSQLERSNAALQADIRTRKEVEEALRQSEQRFHTLFEQCPDAILLLEAEGPEAGRILDANGAAGRMHGCSPAELIGSNIVELDNPEEARKASDKLRHLQRQEVMRMEVTHRRRDGSLVPLEVHAALMHSGNRRFVVAFDRDISARRQAEAQLRTLSRVVEQSPASVVITDPDGTIEHVNAKFTQITGYSTEEAMGRNPRILKSGEMPAERYAELWQTITSGREWRGEFHNRKKNGELFWEAALISPIVNEAGHITHFVGIKEDITEQKRAARRTEMLSRLGTELTAVGDAKTAARSILDAAQELFGWHSAYLSLYQPGTDNFLPIITVDTLVNQLVELPVGELPESSTPLSRHVMELGGQLLNRQQSENMGISFMRFGNQERPSESRMYVPIRKGSEFVGIVSIQSYTANAYTPDDLVSFQALADLGSATLQRITALEALRESEERFRTLFESSPIAIALHDAEGHILEANASYQTMVGYTGEELRKLGVKRITHPEDVYEGDRLYRELVAGTRNHYQREKRYSRKDGGIIWGAAIASAIRGPDGRLRYIISLVEDITKRRQAELAMRELAAIVEHSSDAIFSTTLDGKIASWNKSAERISGYPAEEVLGKPLSLVLSPDQAMELELVLNQLRQGNRVTEFETVCRHKNGAAISVSIAASPVKDSQGCVTAASAIVRDITERKRLEQEILRISSEERRRIGHELHDGLGQLLTGIAFKTKALQGRLLASDPLPAEEAEEIVNLINGAIHQTRLLAQGLDPVELESAGLVVALQNLAAETQYLFGITCTFDCSEQRLLVNDQAGLAFYRITQEAIHNAHTHGAARQVSIRLARTGSRLELTVWNDGRSFEQSQHDRTGMGLRIMQHRARSIGGTLAILPHAERGASVVCSVPFELCCDESKPAS